MDYTGDLPSKVCRKKWKTETEQAVREIIAWVYLPLTPYNPYRLRCKMSPGVNLVIRGYGSEENGR